MATSQVEDNRLQNKPTTSAKPGNTNPPPNVFTFWAYFTISVSLLTLLFILLSSLTQEDDKSWFLGLSTNLRHHYSKGKMIKAQLGLNKEPTQVFVIEDGPKNAETVVLVHGLGCSSYSFRKTIQTLASTGIHAVAIDLPGSGFSEKSSLEEDERWPGFLGSLLDVYGDIKEKGLFWGFDHLIETGGLPDVDNEKRVFKSKSLKPLKYRSDQMGSVIGQVIDSMDLAPVHLFLHDSALEAGLIWAAENRGMVTSVTLVDGSANLPALPIWGLKVPGIREILLWNSWAFVGYLRFCCLRSTEREVAEDYKVLLKGRGGRKAVVEVGGGLNNSFDLGEWGGSETVRDLPVQIVWAGNWSEGWSDEGRRVAALLPKAKFVTHSGGRWPQEDASDEIAEVVTKFVSSLPKSARRVDEEPLPEHIRKVFDEASDESHHHHHHHHGDGHGHDHGGHYHGQEAGYMDAYGLGHGGWS